jgi:hypothetical protein
MILNQGPLREYEPAQRIVRESQLEPTQRENRPADEKNQPKLLLVSARRSAAPTTIAAHLGQRRQPFHGGMGE